MLLDDEEIFQVDPRLRAERRVVGEEQREPDRLFDAVRVELCEQRLGGRAGAEQVLAQRLRAARNFVRQPGVAGQAANQREQRLLVAGPGRTNLVRHCGAQDNVPYHSAQICQGRAP